MKRRNFLKNISLAGLSPLFLNGIPLHVLANKGELQQIAAGSTNDKVLVLIQLHGGNDGLNTLIPLNQYNRYRSLRPNIAIPGSGIRKYIKLDSQLPDQKQIGLHPDMTAFKSLYENGRATIIQSVAYEHVNGSHFRSRDIWLMGGDYDDTFHSGWAGRYLNALHPSYPQGYPTPAMPDPLALEVGNRVSLAFHREDGTPMAMALEDPAKFFELVTKVGADAPTHELNSIYGRELQFIMGVEKKSNQYAERLKKVFDNGRNSSNVLYPEKYPYPAPAGVAENRLSRQLKTIARLLSGGCQTKIFLARLDGFDTHAGQTESHNPTMGMHAALLYNLFTAVKAFQDDLRALGLEDRVLTGTFSEFGRRAESNASFGTDHGTAAPMFLFGKGLQPGVVGTNPDLSNLIAGSNLKHQYDYRQVFATLLQDWMEAPASVMQATKFENFSKPDQKLPLISTIAVKARTASDGHIIDENTQLYDCYPNPATDTITVTYQLNNPLIIKLTINDASGKQLWVIRSEQQEPGKHQVAVNIGHLSDGVYYCVLKTRTGRQTKRFIKINNF